MSSQDMTEFVYNLTGKGISFPIVSVISCGTVFPPKLRGLKQQYFVFWELSGQLGSTRADD